MLGSPGKNWQVIRLIAAFFICTILAACSRIPSSHERNELAETLATKKQWRSVTIPTTDFDLRAFVPEELTNRQQLTVYIEGDGFAWKTANQLSDDPTPLDPIGLKLALRHPHNDGVYLARPCQYAPPPSRGCKPSDWSNERYSEKVIDAADTALNQLKRRFQSKSLTLVGYSGGGTVAALLAARRDDVDHLITVAANLDHDEWTTLHNLTPLDNSLNPADFVAELTHLRQSHFVGARDKVIPVTLVTSFARRFESSTRPNVHVIPGFGHRCCWEKNWPRLWGTAKQEHSSK